MEKISPATGALGLVVGLLAVVSIAGRTKDDVGEELRSERFFATEAVCLEIAGAGVHSAIVEVARVEDAVSRAIRDHGLSQVCEARALPGGLRSGDRIILSRDGQCRLRKVERMSAAARIVCGVGIDVNTDDEDALVTLPGIGPVKAAHIVESRRRDGPYFSAADIERVHGIGPSTRKRIEGWLEWSGHNPEKLPPSSGQ